MSAPPPSTPPFSYRRRPTRRVLVGTVALGADEPIRLQSMTTTDTGDTEATALQALALAEAGCEIVRVTVPNMEDAHALEPLRRRLEQLGVKAPLVADIHFNPRAALFAADFVEKVRINPGNYADAKRFAVREYTDEEYAAELDRIREKFAPLVEKCKRLGRAMRIGTNHGSLSDRIMNRFGDTPLGMVESALEFVRLCEEQDYRELVLSMKASNPFVAVQAYRLLADRMAAEGMEYPFHLGVTEAGFGEDGRLKSAIGIGSLLADGIGDTIRVSLTEDPCREIPVARELAAPFQAARAAERAPSVTDLSDVRRPDGGRRPTTAVLVGGAKLGSEAPVQAWVDLGRPADGAELAARARALVAAGGASDEPLADVAHLEIQSREQLAALETVRPALWDMAGKRPLAVTTSATLLEQPEVLPRILAVASLLRVRPRGASAAEWSSGLVAAARATREADRAFGLALDLDGISRAYAELSTDEGLARSAADAVALCREAGVTPLLSLEPPAAQSPVHATRLALALLGQRGLEGVPVLLVDRSAEDAAGRALLEGGVRLGGLLVDGVGDALLVLGCPPEEALARACGVLQVTRLRMSRPDYIACPSCGRTLFDLEEVTARIQAATSHLKGVKIAIMGCIVNGPGEMADADFGYVGSSPGKINLYVGKDCVEKNIPMEEAEARLVELIKARGRWVEPRSATV